MIHRYRLPEENLHIVGYRYFTKLYNSYIHIRQILVILLANNPFMRVIKIWVFVKSVYIGFELVMIIKCSSTYGGWYFNNPRWVLYGIA